MTDLALIEASWDQAALENATFNILTDPNHREGWPLDEFFAHGEAEIDKAIAHLEELGLRGSTKRALDFGCGVGRLTNALARHYQRVDGVDISGVMINRAHEVKCVGPGHSFYFHNTSPDLKLFKARRFDLVYSMIVLQHMPQARQEGYVREFFRVLKPGGVAMFHTPEGPDSGHPGWHLSMYGVTRETVEQWIAAAGGTLVDVEDLGQDAGWRNLRYTATA